jgi:hypothetical protein
MAICISRERYSVDAVAARSELRSDVVKAKAEYASHGDHVFGRSALISALANVQNSFDIENLAEFFFGAKYADASRRHNYDITIRAFVQHKDLIERLRDTARRPNVTAISAFNVDGFKDEPTATKLAVVSAIEGIVDKSSVQKAYAEFKATRPSKWVPPADWLPEDYTQGETEFHDARYNFEWAVAYSNGYHVAPEGPTDDVDVVFHRAVMRVLADVLDSERICSDIFLKDPIKYFDHCAWVINWETGVVDTSMLEDGIIEYVDCEIDVDSDYEIQDV